MTLHFFVTYLPVYTLLTVITWFNFFEVSYDLNKLLIGIAGASLISVPAGFTIFFLK